METLNPSCEICGMELDDEGQCEWCWPWNDESERE